MTTNEASGLATFAADTIERVAVPVEGVHQAVADRVFRLVGPAGTTVRTVHDAVSNVVYGSIRGTARVLGGATATGLHVGFSGRDVRFLDGSDRGLATLAGVNAAFGDQLAEAGSPLAIEMELFHRGEAVPMAAGPGELAAAVPDAGPTVVVLVHGLGESERRWRGRGPDRPGFGSRLGVEGFTPVAVRYNSGRHISDTGRDLVSLLDRVVERWPVPVERLVLVGHSMGGLVLRAACHLAPGAEWARRTTHIVYLGSPHRGAPLEQLANLGTGALGRLGETRPLATLANGRSAGIKDLRHGYITEDDWRGLDPDVPLEDTRIPVPLRAGVEHCFVSASIGATQGHLVGRIFGDLLVPARSAAPPGYVTLPPEGITVRSRHFPGLHHFDLLHHPAVADQLVEWLRPT